MMFLFFLLNKMNEFLLFFSDIFSRNNVIITIKMSSTNSFLSRSSSYSVQQQLNDLNSTRSSTSSCSTSHCLSNQCIECTTILSTRTYIDQTTNSSQ